MAVIAIDFDHTIVEGDTAKEGAKDAINLLREKGHKIVIHSCNNRGWIEKVLNNNDIRYDHIWDISNHGKPICDLYVDDLGYHFLGDWPADVLAILARVENKDNRKW